MKTVLIANRGEIAVRIIRAVHALGWRAVAVHPADDADSLHVRAADDAVLLAGAGTSAYLNIDALVEGARQATCTIVHPGYGFLSESASFARQCAAAGLTFAGPAPEVLDLFGDKARARQYAQERGVPVLPGLTGASALADVRTFAAEQGAIMIKAVAGGGGRGMRQVTDPADLDEAYAQASAEALRAFGDGALYAEKLLLRPQHIEIQIIGDGSGTVLALGERDCSIQRRHQKLVEVAPSPWLDEAVRTRITDAARQLATGVDYAGLGTFEFLVRGTDFWFMEANPRLQVEHTVTEEVTGLDLVAAQLRLSDGATLAELALTEAPAARGVAIQVRVNVEQLDADGAQVPGAGTLQRFEPPSGPGVRVDTYGYRGYQTSPRYDSLLAKVIVRGADLGQATARVRAALEDFAVEGVPTNLDLLHGIVSGTAFVAKPWDTGFLGAHIETLRQHRRPRTLPGQAGDDVRQTVSAQVPPGAVTVRAPCPGVVLGIDATNGDRLGPEAVVAVIEAMKIEHSVSLEAGMQVQGVLVAEGAVVAAGDPLLYGQAVDGLAPVGRTAPADAGGADWRPEVDEIARRRTLALAMGGPQKLARQHEAGKLDARARVDALTDAGSFAEIGALAGFGSDGSDGRPDFTPANFIAGTARIDGRKVVVGIDDFSLRGGSGDAAIHDKQIFAERYAGEMRLPVVRLLDGASGGGSVKMASDAGYTYVPVNPGWDAVIDNLSVVPVVAAAVGPTVGLGAARLVMSHLAIMVRGIGQLFTAGPPVVLGGTGERLTKEELGGAAIHGSNGTIERIVGSEQEAFETIRRFLSYLPRSVYELPPVSAGTDPVDRRDEALLGAVPRSARHPYDIEHIMHAIFDAGSVFPYADYGGGTVTALARLDGHPVGVIAADPVRGATMSTEGAFAITRLVDLCETFHLPVVSLTDQAGMTIGLAAERAATIRHGARAITAIYQSRIPQAEIIVRRVYGVGGAGIVNRHRAVRSWAWPSGDWGSLPSRGGIEAAFRAQIEAASDPQAELDRLAKMLEAVSSPFRTAEHFGVQDLIDPRDSRPLLCDWVHDAYRLLPDQVGRPAFGTRP